MPIRLALEALGDLKVLVIVHRRLNFVILHEPVLDNAVSLLDYREVDNKSRVTFSL